MMVTMVNECVINRAVLFIRLSKPLDHVLTG